MLEFCSVVLLTQSPYHDTVSIATFQSKKKRDNLIVVDFLPSVLDCEWYLS